MAEKAVAVLSGKPEDIAGRWRLRQDHCNGAACKPLYDIMPCGDGWCGVEVEEDGKCGRTAIRLAVEKSPEMGSFSHSGQYFAADGAEPYVIDARLRTLNTGSTILVFIGHTGGPFQILRRSYLVHMEFDRIGEPACQGEAKMS